MKISEGVQAKLICPETKKKLIPSGEYLVAEGDNSIRYPLVDGVPVLINEKNSIFDIEDFTQSNDTTFNLHKSKLQKIVEKIMPDTHLSIKTPGNYQNLITRLPKKAKILVIGGSIMGRGMEPIYDNTGFEIIGSDVSHGEFTSLICDAHDIPFAEGTFDCVIIQAVLEHVVDPYRCVEECHRVLNTNGIVYAETPFMQQVHMKQYDFTRFTHLGHRRLFRKFEELTSGPAGGPGTALAWSYIYFLRSFTTNAKTRRVVILFAHFTGCFWKYFDYLMIDKPGAYDGASGCIFMGTKSDKVLGDRELIASFKGIR